MALSCGGLEDRLSNVVAPPFGCARSAFQEKSAAAVRNPMRHLVHLLSCVDPRPSNSSPAMGSQNSRARAGSPAVQSRPVGHGVRIRSTSQISDVAATPRAAETMMPTNMSSARNNVHPLHRR